MEAVERTAQGVCLESRVVEIGFHPAQCFGDATLALNAPGHETFQGPLESWCGLQNALGTTQRDPPIVCSTAR